MALDHPLEGSKSRIPQRLIAIGRAGQTFQLGQTLLATQAVALDLAMAQLLAVDDIVAMAAPGIQQHRALAGLWREQLGGGGKALGADGNALFGVIDDVMGGSHG